MASNNDGIGRIRAFVKRSENPYASEEYLPPIDPARCYVHRLQNPYASLSIYADNVESNAPVALPRVVEPEKVEQLISKAEFKKECQRIFRQYVPALEQNRLRTHHKDFISRNESRSSLVRCRLLNHLRKYDLSDLPTLNSHFNREREDLTADKLRQIEIAVERDT